MEASNKQMATTSAQALLEKAREELDAIELLVDHQHVAEWIIGFHAQQVAEKSLKSVLVHRGHQPPKTHDIFLLIQMLEDAHEPFPDWFHELDRLNPFAVLLRYDTLDLIAYFDRGTVIHLVVRVYDWAARIIGGETYEDFDENYEVEPEDDGRNDDHNEADAHQEEGDDESPPDEFDFDEILF